MTTSMIEKKLKHLEFIQNVISRMNSNSFLIKGWTVTLISALFALSAKDANINYVLISYIIIPVFWLLDGFFISVERQYRDLYSKVANMKEDEINFSMDISQYKIGDRTWVCGIFSKTLIPFYGVVTIATLIVMFLIAT